MKIDKKLIKELVENLKEFELSEDIDWMSQFLPGEIPDWIVEIEDDKKRKEMMELMGVGNEFDVNLFYEHLLVKIS